MRRLILPVVVLVIVVSACSTSTGTQLVYERLDWYAKWRAREYLRFNEQQDALFKQNFEVLWRWHRQEELPRYAQDLRKIADALEGTPAATDVIQYTRQFQQHWERSLARAVSELCPIAKTLDDKQVQGILKAVDKNLKEYAEKAVLPPPEKRRKLQEERAENWIKRWAGSLTDEQKALARRWSVERRDTSEAWLAYRKDWRDELERALNQRVAAVNCESFGTLFVTPLQTRSEKLTQDTAYNQKLWRQFTVDAIAAMTEKQRRHAQSELRELAGQFESLATRDT